MDHNQKNHLPTTHNEYHGHKHPKKRPLPLVTLIAIDAAILGACLGLFFYFHKVRETPMVATPLTTPTPTVAAPTQTPAATATPQSQATPEPTVDPATLGQFGARFADKFTDGQVIQDESSYRSRDINVQVQQVQQDGVTYYVADVYIRNIENLVTAFAKDEVKMGISEMPLDIAARNEAVVSITGDYFGFRRDGIVVRNGVLYRETPFEDICVLYRDGTMAAIPEAQVNLEELKSADVYQVWSFGPMLLSEGQPMEKFNSVVGPNNPRSALGYYEPGHYALVLVDGRQAGYSKGMTLKALSQLFYDLGCKQAYNLDGGQSCAMTFGDALMSQPYKGGRPISDIIMIGEVKEN
ncbi:MAG: phosphodiester glycosidase family protein [Eubacteriales bacterium]|nr:phosphodiester glycosidase family protein [Eubacteriales bacterium]